MAQIMTAHGLLGEIQGQIEEEKKSADTATASMLKFLQEAVEADCNLAAWLHSRRRKNAGTGIDDALRRPIEHTTTLWHNPGNNQILLISVFWKEGVPAIPVGVGITVDVYWYQGENNSGRHWYKIIVGPRKELRNETCHYLSGTTDSHWLALLSSRITSCEIAGTVLHEFVDYTIAFEKRHGKS